MHTRLHACCTHALEDNKLLINAQHSKPTAQVHRRQRLVRLQHISKCIRSFVADCIACGAIGKTITNEPVRRKMRADYYWRRNIKSVRNANAANTQAANRKYYRRTYGSKHMHRIGETKLCQQHTPLFSQISVLHVYGTNEAK